jgi:hypothetical protein
MNERVRLVPAVVGLRGTRWFSWQLRRDPMAGLVEHAPYDVRAPAGLHERYSGSGNEGDEEPRLIKDRER